MAKLINDPSSVVGEMLASAALTNPAIKLLDGYHVAVRAALDKAKVAIISGGGSGHAFKMGPAIGDAAAALALGLKPPFSLETFRLDRAALLRA